MRVTDDLLEMEALCTGEAMKDPGAFLDRFAAEFRIATGPPA